MDTWPGICFISGTLYAWTASSVVVDGYKKLVIELAGPRPLEMVTVWSGAKSPGDVFSRRLVGRAKQICPQARSCVFAVGCMLNMTNALFGGQVTAVSL